MFGRILGGFLLALVGGCVMYFASNLAELFGEIPRASKNLGSTRNGYLAFGFIVSIIGFLLMFGVIGTQTATDVGSFPGTQPTQ